MKRWISGGLVVVFVSAMVLLACAPKAAPSPAVPAAPQATTPLVTRTPAAPVVSAEDAAWQKVVEAAKKEGKATLYVTFRGDTGEEIRKAFKKRYGVDLDIITGRGAEFIERLKTEQRMGTMVADVAQVASAFLLAMKNLDLLEVAPGLPSLRNKGDFRVNPLLDRDGYMLRTLINSMGPMVNTKLVRPDEEPKSWQDMLNPKWKGKMIVTNPLLNMGMYMTFIPLLNAKAITLEWLRDIGKQDIKFTIGDTEVAQRLSQGEYPLAVELSTSTAGPYAAQGAPIKAIPMAEGIAATSGGMIAQVKNGPHPNVAKLFLNWLLSEEGQTILNKTQGSYAVREDVPDFRPQALVLPPGSKTVSETEFDVEDMGKKFQDKWLIDLWGK